MNRTLFRALIALSFTLAAVLFPLTHTNVSTATVKGTVTNAKRAAVPKATPRLVCARGVKESGGHGVRIDITLAVQEGEDAGEIAREALGREGVRPIAQNAPTGEFALSGLRWPQFFDHNRKNDLVVQVYNPDDQNFPGAADAAANVAGHTWADVPTATFAGAVGGTTSDPSPGFDGVNAIVWPAEWPFSDRALAVTTTTFDIATGFIVADVAFNRRFPFSLNPSIERARAMAFCGHSDGSGVGTRK